MGRGVVVDDPALLAHYINDCEIAHSSRLETQTFRQRVGPNWSADVAAPNAARYAGIGRRMSYAEIHRAVWVEQRWPELCEALAGKGAA